MQTLAGYKGKNLLIIGHCIRTTFYIEHVIYNIRFFSQNGVKSIIIIIIYLHTYVFTHIPHICVHTYKYELTNALLGSYN